MNEFENLKERLRRRAAEAVPSAPADVPAMRRGRSAAHPIQSVERRVRSTAQPATLAAEASAKRISSHERWHAKVLSDLDVAGLIADWVLEGYLAKGNITSLTGLWKAGKTTLITYMIKALAVDGEFAGLRVTATRVLIISEEGEQHWAIRRDDLDIGDHVAIISRPFLARPTLNEWSDFITDVARQVREGEFGLVIIDAMPNLWPVRDENAASDVIGALMPLHALTAEGAAVLLVFHPGKSDAGEGRATRGSGATGAFVDIIVELRRYDAERRDDSRRVLVSYSRHRETPDELVVDYTEGEGYTVEGTRAEVRTDERIGIAVSLLTDQAPGATPQEVRARWPTDQVRPSLSTVERDLKAALSRGFIQRTGQGFRNDPYRYYSRSVG